MEVLVYSTPTCPWCIKVKEFLKSHNIEFEDFDVSKDEKLAEELVKKSGQRGVPVTDIDGKIIIGFNEEKLKEALNL